MADNAGWVVASVLIDERVVFTLPEFCRASGADRDELLALVHEGLLAPTGDGPEVWLFSGSALLQARRALRLARELDIGLEGAAIVIDLLDEIETLRTLLRRRSDA